MTDLLFYHLLSCAGALDAIATLDDICLEAYRSRAAMKFQEQAASIAEHRTNFIASPEGCR